MAVTTVTNPSELLAWIAAREAQGTYTENEFAAIPDGTVISVTGDIVLNPVNAGAFEAVIGPAAGGEITGRLWPVYGGTRSGISMGEYSSFTIAGKGRMRGLQLARTGAAGGAWRVQGGGQFQQCIFDAGVAANTLLGDATGGGKAVACLMVTSAAGGGYMVNVGDSIELDRCTVVANGGTNPAFRSDYGGLKLIGTAVLGFSSDLVGTLAAGCTHNATSAGTALGTSGQTGLAAADFVNTTSGSEDYSRASGSTKLGNTGTAISGVTTDLYGTSIPQGAAADIGAHEMTEVVAAPTLTGTVTLDDATASGTLQSVLPSTLTGTVQLDGVTASGTLATQLATVTTLPFTRNPGNGGRVVSIANVALAVLTDDANLARLAGSAGVLMGSDGRVTLANAVPAPPGSTVVVVTREPDGKLGVERYTLS